MEMLIDVGIWTFVWVLALTMGLAMLFGAFGILPRVSKVARLLVAGGMVMVALALVSDGGASSGDGLFFVFLAVAWAVSGLYPNRHRPPKESD